MYSDSLFEKLRWSLPWLLRYPAWRAGEWARRFTDAGGQQHLIFLVANNFEPLTTDEGLIQLDDGDLPVG